MIDQSSLIRCLDRPSPIRDLADALLSNVDCGFALMDALMESGDLPMLTVGQCYMVKTAAHYYLGRVREASYSSVILEMVSEVYDTGEIGKCWTTGKPTTYENYPDDVTVTISTGAIVACPSWPKPLPRGDP